MGKEGDAFLLVLVVLIVACILLIRQGGKTEISSFGRLRSEGAGGGGGGDDEEVLGFFSDAEGTSPLSRVDWGTLDPASSADVDVYIENLGDRRLFLSVSTENWDPPEAQNYMNLTWNFGGSIDAGNVEKTTLTLSVAEDITGIVNFSFDIVVLYEEAFF